VAASCPFFAASRNALDAITRLYDFVWPTAAAIWNLRWQVAGYNQVRDGTTTVEELKARFVEGSGIHGANLHRSCLEHSWDKQRADLAFVALVNLFAIYEGWTVELVAEIRPTLPAGFDAEKALQFPNGTGPGGKPRGAGVAIQHLSSPTSGAMASDVRPALMAQQGVHAKHLDEMLVVYRYFKECRNSLMHVGGKATANAVSASSDIAALAATTLPFKIPRHSPVLLNAPVVLDLYGVVGFSDIVRRLILTIDAELTGSAAAEAVLKSRWQQTVGVVGLPSGSKERHSAIVRHMRRLGVRRLVGTTKLEQALKTAGLVT
jgi:hypothetical protein